MVGTGSKHIYRAYNNSVNALERALKERLIYYKDGTGYREIPKPVQEVFKVRTQDFETAIKRLSTWTLPTETDTFCASFSGQKRLRYEKAAKILRENLWDPKWAEVKMFLKFESYNFTLKPDAKPRGIYPRSDEFLVDYGRRIKAIEKKVYKDIEVIFGYDIIFKGKNQLSRGALLERYWNEIEDPVAISADASAFEASVSNEALAFCHRIYNYYIRGDKQFIKLQGYTRDNKLSGYAPDGNVRARFAYGKMSGDPDTALGNCLVSAAMMYTFFQENGIDKHRGCIDGDDVVFIVSRRDLHKVLQNGEKFYLDYGFRMIFEKPVYELEKLTFCQSQPIWTEHGYLMVRNPRNATAKDAFSRKDLSSKTDYQRWIASIGDCGISTCGGIPVLQEYYQQFIRNSSGAKIFQNDSLFQEYKNFKNMGMSRKYSPVKDRTRYSFYIAFDIAPDEQIAIEQYYANLTLEHGLSEDNVMPTPDLPW